MFRQKSPAPSARYGLYRYRWRRGWTATAPPEAEPVAPPRTRRGRSKAVNRDDAAAVSSLQRRRCKSYDNLSFSTERLAPFSEPAVTPPRGSAPPSAAAEKSIDSAEGFGRRFRRSVRRISKAKVMRGSLR